jgi:mono/diheme cytochrome c family protein
MTGVSAQPLAGLAILLLVPSLGWAFPWSQDMRDQPSVKAQEVEITTSKTSVPTGGKELFLAPADTAELVRDRLTAGLEVSNPAPRSPESINRGKAVYDVYCMPCHGMEGHGDGQVGLKFTPPPMDLTLSYVQIQPDGQIHYTISHGSIAMPFYRDAIPVIDRWHVVNYIKTVLVQNER